VRAGAAAILVIFATTAQAGKVLPEDAPRRVLLAQAAVPRNATIEKAQSQVDEGDFELAVKTLKAGLDEPDLTDDQLAEMYRLMGLAYLYLSQEKDARDAFEKLLQAQPDYELPRTAPPKIRALYARIKDDIKKRRVRPVTLDFSPPDSVAGDGPMTLAVKITDMALGAKARLFFRRAGVQNFSSMDLARKKGSRIEYSATIPGFELPAEDAAWQLEYYVEVTDAAQRRLAGRGDAYSPLTVRVEPKQGAVGPVVDKTPWYQNPWVWVGVGAGVAAVATGAVLLATQQQPAELPIKIQIEGTP